MITSLISHLEGVQYNPLSDTEISMPDLAPGIFQDNNSKQLGKKFKDTLFRLQALQLYWIIFTVRCIKIKINFEVSDDSDWTMISPGTTTVISSDTTAMIHYRPSEKRLLNLVQVTFESVKTNIYEEEECSEVPVDIYKNLEWQ